MFLILRFEWVIDLLHRSERSKTASEMHVLDFELH